MKIVIRAGGIGVRLWPLSRQNDPKQFQVLLGESTMLATTYQRALAVVQEPSNIYVSVSSRHLRRAQEQLPNIPLNNFIVESDVRNTGPAMCLESAYLSQYLPDEEVVASLPSDDFISDNQAFADLLLLSENFIKQQPDYIVTPAVRPSYPDTGYSYMKLGSNLSSEEGLGIYQVAEIVEKPAAERCQALIDSGVYYCHTGMYVWRLGQAKALFEKYQPTMWSHCRQAVELMQQGATTEEIAAVYALTEKISIESAITGRTELVAMSVSNNLGWSDLGKWHIIKRLLSDPQANLLKGKVVARSAAGNLVYNTVTDKVVVINDVNNLVIVDTPDALYISSLEQSAEIKECLDELRQQGCERHL